jgi:SET domain-containing protein
VDVVKYMVYRNITDHRRIWEITNKYGKEPEEAVERMRKELREGGIEVGA